jgi:hypothetical protein
MSAFVWPIRLLFKLLNIKCKVPVILLTPQNFAEVNAKIEVEKPGAFILHVLLPLVASGELGQRKSRSRESGFELNFCIEFYLANFRRIAPAKPINPVPSRMRLEGSGVEFRVTP